jgi:hypothetical protein
MSPESGNPIFRRPYADHLAEIRPEWPDLAKTSLPERPNFGLLAGFQQIWQIPASMPESSNFWPESGHFHRNPANPDSDETVRIPAFILNYGYSSRND